MITRISQLFNLFSLIPGKAQVACYRGDMCPVVDEIGQFNTPQDCCILDEAVSWESGGEPCTECLSRFAIVHVQYKVEPLNYRDQAFVFYREVVLSSEVKMYSYNREGTSRRVLYRDVLMFYSIIHV